MTETQLVSETAGPDAIRSRTYEWTEPIPAAHVLGAMSGMETFAAMGRGELPIPPIMATMGVDRVVPTAEGQVSVFMEAQEYHYNPLGSVHGGVISMLLDTAAACAVHTTLPAGVAYTSLDLNVRFLKPVTSASGMLRCEGVVLSRGRTTALGEARLYDGAGRMVAHATSTCIIFPVR
jgi:uncharacterized protein (TIGR00369 family)